PVSADIAATRLSGPRARVLHQPAHGERDPALGPHLDRDLVGGAADAAGTDLDDGLGRVEGALEDGERVLLGPLRDQIEGAVEDALDEAALSVVHHRAHELRDRAVPVLGVRQDVLSLDFTFARHARAPLALGRAARRGTSPRRAPGARWSSLRSLGSVFRAALAPILDTDRVQRAADDVVAHTRKVLHATAADEHHRVLLEVVPDTRNVGRHLDAVREPDA